jgi:hypothetical protein
MNCDRSPELVSSLLDQQLTAGEREAALAHVDSCGECRWRFRLWQGLRQILQASQAAAPPEDLGVRLRVAASHAQQWQWLRRHPLRLVAHWTAPLRLAFERLAKPMALPLAGGLLSALLLFGSVLQQAFPDGVRNDVPTMMYTDPDGQVVDWTLDNMHYFEDGQDTPRLEPVNAEITGNATVVEVTVDPDGRVADYTVVRGQLPSEAKNLFMWSRFTPATLFGQPTWGKKLVLFRCPAPTRG